MPILGPDGKPMKSNQKENVLRLRKEITERLARFKYDAAQNTNQNELHWNSSDNLSPNSANTLSVRKKLRARSRYEVANNGYLRGILLSMTEDFVGNGPTLQITDDRFNDSQKDRIEKRWSERAKKIKLRRQLWKMRHARVQDGESFSVSFINGQLKHPVKTDNKILECDHFTDPGLPLNPGSLLVDGIEVDRISGQPLRYFVLDNHPGEQSFFTQSSSGQWVDAENVTHWYRQDRPWLRGIPETTPTLPLWALLRRYTLAVVQNAEIAADFTALLTSQQPPSTSPFDMTGTPLQPSNDASSWFDSFPIDRGLMTVLPWGYEMQQLDPRQPVTMYDTFVNALIQEAVRPLLCPRNHALGNSGGYNMSSGTLDRQMYRRAVEGERQDCEDEVLCKDLYHWWYEATRVFDYFDDEFSADPISKVVGLYDGLRDDVPLHLFRWDDIPEHTDPVKVATSLKILWDMGQISDTDIQEGRFNRRVGDHYRNIERQNQWRVENGLPLPGDPTSDPTMPQQDQQEEDQQGDQSV